jgi:hypothetical protein
VKSTKDNPTGKLEHVYESQKGSSSQHCPIDFLCSRDRFVRLFVQRQTVQPNRNVCSNRGLVDSLFVFVFLFRLLHPAMLKNAND